MIFSDYEEIYNNETIFDALESVSPDILANHEDFALHRRLKQDGRAALDRSELSGSDSVLSNPNGNANNPGWKLDKWKFLPMVNRTLFEHPDMKWYVFIEADTFILWSMLQQYLAAIDHTKPYYAGSRTFIGSDLFAHGGSGFVVSQPAMRLTVDRYAEHKAEIEAFTNGHWAGDCVLGTVLRDAGVVFTDAWPTIQGYSPGLLPYAREWPRASWEPTTRWWCYPALSYHHLSPDMTKDVWDWEQQWIENNGAVSSASTSSCLRLCSDTDASHTERQLDRPTPPRRFQGVRDAAHDDGANGLEQRKRKRRERHHFGRGL